MPETTVNDSQPKVAILIDAENVSADLADLIFSNAAACGVIVVREIYGTATALTSWIQPVLKYAIHPNLTVKASKSKNSSDISLVIGAMDLLSYREITTMVIVSSDSDFSSLSVRLRADGINVVGMGAEKANPLWRTSCTSFVALNEKKTSAAAPAVKAAASRTEQKATPARAETATTPAPVKKQTHEERLENIRNYITELLKAENGRMPMTRLFQSLNRFHDYQVDQSGSRRRPLNYLQWAFSNTFFFQETPNGMIISLEPLPKTPVSTENDAKQETPAQNPAAKEEEPKQDTQAEVGETTKNLPDGAEETEQNTITNEAETVKAEPEKEKSVESTVTETREQPVSAKKLAKNSRTKSRPTAKSTTARGKTKAKAGDDQASAEPAASASEMSAPQTANPGQMPIAEIKAIPARIRKALISRGKVTLAEAAQVSDEDLQSIPQVGAATIAAFRRTVNELMG